MNFLDVILELIGGYTCLRWAIRLAQKAFDRSTERQFTCEMCRETFNKGWSDDEAAAESATLFPALSPTEAATVCDDCFVKIMRDIQ